MTLHEYTESLKGKKIGIIGIGVSNDPLIRHLLQAGCSVTACDRRSRDEMGEEAAELEALGARLKLGETYLENLDFDILFRTPGLMPFDPHLQAAAAAGAEITSEMEVFFRVCPCRILAVTGSDGKTTTSTIIAELLKAAGYRVHLGGNIGHPLLCEAEEMQPEDFVVLELSSFQLHSMRCRPNVSVITNISPNHLDKHKDFDDYVRAKTEIYHHQLPEDLLVLNLDDAHTPLFAAEAGSRLRFFSLEREVENGVFCENEKLYRVNHGAKSLIMAADEIFLPGLHNRMNYMAAFAATADFVPDEICRSVAQSFHGVEHRLETVRVLRGVTFINDSIGTSPTRTIAGLNALKTKPIILVGGYDKHIPFDSLGQALCRKAKAVIATGATAEKICEAVRRAEADGAGSVPLMWIDDFDEAVFKAAEIAEAGDIVLLSPACAAFDHFKNFMERGKHFKELIRGLT